MLNDEDKAFIESMELNLNRIDGYCGECGNIIDDKDAIRLCRIIRELEIDLACMTEDFEMAKRHAVSVLKQIDEAPVVYGELEVTSGHPFPGTWGKRNKHDTHKARLVQIEEVK